MTGELAFLLIPLSFAVVGSVLLWLLARGLRRRRIVSASHLRAFRNREGQTPRPQPSGIVTMDSPSDKE